MTSIEWTKNPDGSAGKTWNPVRGCVKVSPGCKHCYAETFAERWRGIPGHPYEQGFDPRLVPEKLGEPLRWRKPTTVFANSMSDLFGEFVPDEYIAACFGVMAACQRHTFQVLTKRAERLPRWFMRVSVDMLANAIANHFDDDFACGVANYINGWSRWKNQPDDSNPLNGTVGRWPLPNVHLGVSVEDRKYGLPRIDHLRRLPAAVRFLSAEPLLEDLGTLNLDGIHWVIVGGESGPGARPMHPDWVRSVRDQCQIAAVPFFYKQRLERGRKVSLPMLDGRQWAEMPHAR